MASFTLFMSPPARSGDEHSDHGHESETKAVSLTDDLAKEFGIAANKAEGGAIDTYISLFGKVGLHPERSVHLHPKYAGMVRDVLKATGETVQAGDVLARIENNVGVQTYDLVSPISGVVLNRHIAAGQSVNEEIEAFTVADTSVVLVSLIAYARDLSKLKIGQKVIINSSRHMADSSDLAISYISPILDDHTRTAKAHLVVQNEHGKWHPGQFVIGKVAVGTRQALVRLPRSILPDLEGTAARIVFIKSGATYVPRPIALGVADSNFVEVVSGLAPGDDYLSLKAGTIDNLLKEKGRNAPEKK